MFAIVASIQVIAHCAVVGVGLELMAVSVHEIGTSTVVTRASDVERLARVEVASRVGVVLLECGLHRVPPIGLWPLVKTNCTQLKRLTQECV